jgi:hypothetical protein
MARRIFGVFPSARPPVIAVLASVAPPFVAS